MAFVVTVLAAGGSIAWAAMSPQPENTQVTLGASPAPSVSPAPTPSPQPFPMVPAGDGRWDAVAPDVSVAAPSYPWGPRLRDWPVAVADAEALSLEVLAGQVIVAQWNSPDADGAAELVSDLGLGGIIVMGGAVDDRKQVSELTQSIREAGGERDWGTIIGVDEEGGTVSRLRPVLPDMPAFMAAGAARDKGAVTDAYAHQGADLADLGFTMNYAPIADVTQGPADPVIRSRSAGDDPDRVASTVTAAMDGYTAVGVLPVVKHFPGHGSVDVDSHHGLPVQDAPVSELEARDLVPFREAIRGGVPAVMMSHIAIEDWGDEPSSLNPEAYAYLRNEAGFTGLAITDALNMEAVAETHDAGEAAVAAVSAGADVVLLPGDPRQARDALVDAVENGDLSRERLTEAAARIILAGRWQAGLSQGADAGSAYPRDLAIAGATVASADCEGPFIGDKVSIRGGSGSAREALAEALEERGVVVGDGGTSIGLAGGSTTSVTADVAVALSAPWGLEDSSAETYVGIYGASKQTMEALADVLTGAASPGGSWPVELDLPVGVCGE